MSEQNDYHFSFFKPTTKVARHNRNMVLQLIVIWALAIFGFQFLLKIMEKPTPEPVYALYEKSWPSIEDGSYQSEDLQAAAQASLSILGKVSIQDGHHQALNNAVSWFAWELADSSQQVLLKERMADFETTAGEISDINDPGYIEKKSALYPLLADLFGLKVGDVRVKIAPLEIKTGMMGSFSEENKTLVCDAMDLYLVHMRSALTDAKFLGFPFHYFYTAVFLLILFVGLCWIYCIRTDMFNKKYGIEE